MKTSELKRIVEENGYEFKNTGLFIIISYFGRAIMTLDLLGQSITLDNSTRLASHRIKKIMVALIECSLTPPSEREDEKKYQLKVNEFNKRIIGVDYVEQIKTTLRGTPEGNQKYIFDSKDIFTQKEIDDFPAGIKGAIECGFLRKVEVE